MATLPDARSYAELRRGFRWRIPARFNIAEAVCDRWARAEPERSALLMRGDGALESWSYGRLAERAMRLANLLAARGVERGTRVALLLPQSADVVAGHVAIYRLGAVAVPLAVLFGPEALCYRLEDSGAQVLITDRAGVEKVAELRSSLPGLAHVLCIDGAADGAEALDPLLARARPHHDCVATGPDDPALMIYTSGTTGSPKGALHGHRVLLGHLPGVQMHHEFLPREGDRLWTPADWAWAGGLLNVLLPGLCLGVPVVGEAVRGFDPEWALRLMAQARVRNSFLPPTALKMLRTVPDPRGRFALDLRTIGSGGESLGRETYEWAQEALGLTVNEFYGQTECNLVLSACAALGITRAGAIGVAVPGHNVAVIGPQGETLPPGELGQIAVRRPDPVMFLGYWKRPEATVDKFIGDWMTTGDQGVMDADGYIGFVGRDDDVITSAGYRIGPGEIEDCLLAHPAVALAAAVGKPDPVRTEIVKAFIVLKPGKAPSDALKGEIQDHVRSRLAAHEYPREIAFVDALPLTTTGKVIRRALRERG